MEENIIDFKEWNVPTSWNEISLKKFQDIEKFFSDKEQKFDIREVINILCDKTIDEVNALPAEFLDIILEKLSFISTQPEIKEPTNKIVIDGETYTVHFENQLKVGELIATDTVMKNDKHNYAYLLGIICRKDGEIYDSKFENEILEDRVKLFEKQPITNILPLVGFFMNSYITLESISLLCMKTQEAVNLIQQNIDNSHKIGLCKKLYLTWQMGRLRKRLKSINNTQTTSYSTSHTSLKKGKWKRLKNVFRIT